MLFPLVVEDPLYSNVPFLMLVLGDSSPSLIDTPKNLKEFVDTFLPVESSFVIVFTIAYFNEGINVSSGNLPSNKEINTIPNIITMSRIISSPLLAIAIANDMKFIAFSGCIIFAFTDWLDGYLATKLNQKTVLGAFLDPVADKVFIIIIIIIIIFSHYYDHYSIVIVITITK